MFLISYHSGLHTFLAPSTLGKEPNIDMVLTQIMAWVDKDFFISWYPPSVNTNRGIAI